MLLGIVLHASLSFFPSYWIVTDCRQQAAFGIVFSAIHGFRMPLFFVMSGFFSAMLLHRRGRGALVKHRFQRVFLPLLAGMFTIVPLTIGISTLAMSSASRKTGGAATAKGTANIWAAARGRPRRTSSGTSRAEWRWTPWTPNAAGRRCSGRRSPVRPRPSSCSSVEALDVNASDRDGGTALHAAAFLGHENAVDALLRHGANVNAANKSGSTPLDVAILDEGTTRYFASLLQLELNEDGLGRRKAAIAESLRQHGAMAGRNTGVANLLMQMPLFNHLWFLWFLWWLVLAYAAVSALGSRLPPIRLPGWLVLSPARYLWLVPLTMIPQWYMGDGGTSPIFGPDTSTGLLPIPHVFAYYAIFFGFGAAYFGFDDRSGRVGEHGGSRSRSGSSSSCRWGWLSWRGGQAPRATGSPRCRAGSSPLPCRRPTPGSSPSA